MSLYFLLFFTTVSSHYIIQKDDYCNHLMCENVLNRKRISDRTEPCSWSMHMAQAVNNNTECTWSKNNLQYQTINNDTGLVLFKFDYPPASCDYNKFHVVDLYVEDETNQETLHSSVLCNNIHFENDKITATFSYVFSGIYFVKINDLKSSKIHINTQYELKKLDNTSLQLINNPEEVNKNLKVTLNFEPSYFFDGPPEVLIRITCMFHKTNSNNTCKTINSSCVSVNTSLSCSYENIEPRNYYLEFDIIDDVRCNPLSIFCKNNREKCCKFYTLIETNNVSSDKKMEDNATSAGNTFTVISVIAVISTILAVAAVTFYKKYYKYSSPSRATPTYVHVENQDFNHNYEILLVYARDAEVFTKMITAFKNVIKIDDNVIISDIYDFDGKNIDPMRWLEEKLVNSKTKVILFLNECASLVYKHGTNIYKEPHCFDHLFMQSLVFLTNSRLKRSYENIFVTKLASTSDDNCFNFLNPFVRYSMPQHINKLLNDMCLGQDKKIDKLSLTEFKKKCIDCLKFYEKNTDYMYKLLNVEKEESCD